MKIEKEWPPCPVALFLQLVGNKWKILIIRDLLTGVKRFGQLQRSVGCAQKVLTGNLKELEACGLVSRTAYAEVPPRVEYALTSAGESLTPVLKIIEKWGEDYRRGILSVRKKALKRRPRNAV